MSVRNILDGTITIGAGGLTPESNVLVNTLEAVDTVRGLFVVGQKGIGTEQIDASIIKITGDKTTISEDNITTPSLTATESITATKTIHADSSVSAPGVSATLFSGGSFKGSNVDAGFITAENWIKTLALEVAGTQVLTPTKVEDNQSIAVTYSDGNTATISNTVISETTNFNSQQHVLT